MVEISDAKADIIVGLLAQLVAASTNDEPVVALTNAGMKQSEVARVLGMKLSTVGMRISRAASKTQTRESKHAKED